MSYLCPIYVLKTYRMAIGLVPPPARRGDVGARDPGARARRGSLHTTTIALSCSPALARGSALDRTTRRHRTRQGAFRLVHSQYDRACTPCVDACIGVCFGTVCVGHDLQTHFFLRIINQFVACSLCLNACSRTCHLSRTSRSSCHETVPGAVLLLPLPGPLLRARLRSMGLRALRRGVGATG